MNAAASRNSPIAPTSSARSVRDTMGWVLIGLVPGIVVRVHVYGISMLWQIALALSVAWLAEALLLRLRGHSLGFLLDGSATVTAVLFAVCLPAGAAWWVVAGGICAALLFGKHLYGGLGRNPFNPAMLGVALALACFPATLAIHSVELHSTELHFIGDQPAIWIACADAIGGLLLLWLRIVRWQLSLAVFIGTVFSAGALMFAGAAIASRELLAGNLVLAAFFIASDPVTGCVTSRGRWVFGIGVGLLIVLLQRIGASAGSLPFAILLMNCAAPWIDSRMQPRQFAGPQHG